MDNMKLLTGTAISLCIVAATGLAAKLPTNTVRGQYLEARTADVYTGPCFANGEVGQTGRLAVMGWHIEKGSFQGVNLAGLSVVGVVRAQGTLGDFIESSYPVKAVVIVDQMASVEQQLALKAFAKQMAGDLLSDVVRTEVQPIRFSIKDGNVHSRVAEMSAGSMAKVATRALTEGDQICHNEDVWYRPLAKVDHSMAAYTMANSYQGQGLGETWSYPEKRSAFVATFSLED
jgi:hypothetical protein